jgi:hypothetical protein
MTTIDTDQTTTLIANEAQGEYIVNKTLHTPGLAIDASGALAGRQITVNGALQSDAGTAVIIGDKGLADSDTFFKLGLDATFTADGKGLVASSGGVTINNVGTWQTASTAITLAIGANVLENDGALSSTAGSAIVTTGAADNLNNTAAATITARLDAIVSTGARTTITNSGTATITSTAGSAIVARGDRDTLYSTSAISAYDDAIVTSGLRSRITNAGDSSIVSSHGRGLVATGDHATITNQASVTARGDAVLATGAGATIDNSATLTSTRAAAIHSTGSSATVTNSTLLDARTIGILSSGDHATITNFGNITADKIGIRVAGDDAVVTTKSHVTAATAISISGNDATLTIENEIAGTSKTAAAIVVTATGETAITNRGAVHADRSGLVLEAGKGAEHVLNTGSLYGDVRLGAGDDWFSALKGEVTGKVYGGAGNDVYVVGVALDIVEKAGQGIDTVQSKFTWTLGANLENLTLLGKAAMDATGNGLANRIQGNAGNNHLTGGAGNDVFVFETGAHRDIVTDFADRHDRIDLSGYDHVSGFADIAGHIAQSGADVVITLDGHDRLTIENIDKSALSAADFIF